MENLARSIIRASFSQESMHYLDQERKIVYASKACSGPPSKDGNATKVFDTLELLASMHSHIPNRGEQMVIPTPQTNKPQQKNWPFFMLIDFSKNYRYVSHI